MSEARNITVPDELKDFIMVEHCDDFPINRYMLTKEQAQIGKDILHIRKRVEEMRSMNIDYLNATLLYGVPGTGKAQPLSALVLTPKRFVKMGDIKPGDEIMTPDGTPAKVLGVYPQGKKSIYRMRFADGATCECTEEHLWEAAEVEAENGIIDRRSVKGKTKTMTTLELIEKMAKGKTYGIRCIGKINLNGREVSVSKAVEQIKQDPGHIPDRYLDADYDSRMAILNALTGRTGNNNQTIHITYVDRSMLYCVYKLAWSVGVLVNRLKTEEGEFKLLFTYPPEDGHNIRKIVSIEAESREEECQCIYVDSPDHLYITDCYTVTHNTTFGRYMAYKLDWDFAFINFANLVGGVMGDTSRNITRVFNYMAGQKCIFMMDELDCISIRRGTESTATGGELSRITITVMQNLDLYKRRKVDSILIAATNVISTIDPALMSRFAIKKEIKPWNNEDKEKFARKYLGTIEGLKYDPENVHRYCTENSTLQQREIEADIVRNIGEWLDNDRSGFVLKHIDERTSVY